MNAAVSGLRRVHAAQEGGVAIEYALLASLMAVVCAAALLAFSDAADGLWRQIAQALAAAFSGSPPAP